MENILLIARALARSAHKGQTRWDKKTPYITHPIAVARALEENGYDDEIIAAGYLHDVLEDTKLTRADLETAGIPKQVIDIVEILTKKEGQGYLSYILTIADNYDARPVKIEDIRHNMSCFPRKKGSLYQKYELALYILVERENRENSETSKDSEANSR